MSPRKNPHREQYQEIIQSAFVFGILVFFAVFWILVLSGCSTPALTEVGQDFANGKRPAYRYDLGIAINGQPIDGTGVVPHADNYDVKVYPPDKIDRIIFQTCSRLDTVDKPQSGFWQKLNQDDSYSYSYVPTNPLEINGDCAAIKITFMKQDGTRVAFALIDFDDVRPEYRSILGTMICNGRTLYNHGVLVCQSGEGLIQQISFDRPVKAGLQPGCQPMQDIDGKGINFRWAISINQCLYKFEDKDGNRFRLTSVGYDEVPFY